MTNGRLTAAAAPLMQNVSGKSDGLAKWLLYGLIISTTFLQKFALPLGGHEQTFLALPLVLGATALGFLAKRLEINSMQCVLFGLLAGGFILTQLLGPGDTSIPSLMLVLVVHLPYVFRLRSGMVEPGMELRFLQKISLLIAVIAVLQYALQFIIGSKYAFFLDTQLSKQWVVQYYNKLNALHYGSNTYKSNGVFLLEASFLCQLMAISIVIEMIYFKRMRFILLYCAGILVSFSGTGLIILALLTPAYLIQRKQFLLLAAIVAALTLLISFAPLIGLGDYVGRAGEFSNTHTSGFARFIAIFYLLHDFILSDADTLFFGLGAGSIKNAFDRVSYTAHDPTWGKIVFEYGLVGCACYWPLMLYALFAGSRTPYLKTALAIQFAFLGGYALIPPVHCMILALLAWPNLDEPFKSEDASDGHLPTHRAV